MQHQSTQSRQADRRPRDPRPSTLGRATGFTLVELMIVMTVIAILLGLLGVVLSNMGSQAREAATMATIKKIHAQLEQRMEAFDRQINRIEDSSRIDAQYQSLEGAVRQSFPGITSDRQRILVRKELMRANFPQGFADAGLTPTAGHAAVTESSEMLYYMLTQMKVGESPPVDAGEFLSSEVADFDNDGRMEFVDAWGNPLRFYRWPTRLIRPNYDPENPNNDDPDHVYAPLLIQGLPGHSQDQMLKTDGDDPLGLLVPDNAPASASTLFESNYHTPNTYHPPLIVSAGPDGALGLREPYENDPANGNFGYLAQPVPASTPAELSELSNALSDNITNRNQRSGD